MFYYLLVLTGDCREQTATPALFSHIIYKYIYRKIFQFGNLMNAYILFVKYIIA